MRARIDNQGGVIIAVFGFWLALITAVLMTPIALAGRGKTWGLVLLLLCLPLVLFLALAGCATISTFGGYFGYGFFAPLLVEGAGIYLWLRQRRQAGRA